jgi:hypothetical protein
MTDFGNWLVGRVKSGLFLVITTYDEVLAQGLDYFETFTILPS